MDEGDEQDVVVKWTTCEGTQPFLCLHFEASLQGQQEQTDHPDPLNSADHLFFYILFTRTYMNPPSKANRMTYGL